MRINACSHSERCSDILHTSRTSTNQARRLAGEPWQPESHRYNISIGPFCQSVRVGHARWPKGSRSRRGFLALRPRWDPPCRIPLQLESRVRVERLIDGLRTDTHCRIVGEFFHVRLLIYWGQPTPSHTHGPRSFAVLGAIPRCLVGGLLIDGGRWLGGPVQIAA